SVGRGEGNQFPINNLVKGVQLAQFCFVKVREDNLQLLYGELESGVLSGPNFYLQTFH
ncbi:hypothetical protein A2U01_0103430, partial [Trifolium medium]|nr:hypothetical protein [Trifolium medium]